MSGGFAPGRDVMAEQYRADHVGSFLRPAELLEARRNGKDPQRLHELEDRHIARVLAKQNQLGFEIFTDGELRRRYGRWHGVQGQYRWLKFCPPV